MQFVGFCSTHPRSLADDPSSLQAYVELLVSPTWPRQPQRLTLVQGPRVRPSGPLSKAELAPVVAEMLLHPNVDQVGLDAYMSDAKRTLGIAVATRTYGPDLASAFGHHPIPDDPATIEPWIEHLAAFFERTRTPQAVIFSFPLDACLMEASFVGAFREGVMQHPWPEQFERMRRAKRDGTLGTTYVRYPRWGTLYSHAHVAALGGVAAIEHAVEPAVIRELSGGVYVQLTASVATATSPEAYTKQTAFTELAAPLLPPPLERV